MTEQDQARIADIVKDIHFLYEVLKEKDILGDHRCPYSTIAPVEPNTIAQEVEPIKEEREKPEIGEDYFLVTSEGNIITDCWDDRWWDNSRFKFGNCFPTEEEAQIAADKIKQLLKEL